MKYLDFEIEISPGNAGDYSVAVIRSPAGEARESVRFPSELQLANRLKDLEIALLRSGVKRRLALSSEEQTIQKFGREIFDLLLPNEIRGLYRTSLDKALTQDCGLRLKLRLKESPELAVLPWEFLYDPNEAEYVCLSQDTSIVRYIELPRPPIPLKVTPPLHILGMVASPTNLPQLDVAREKERVNQALADLQADGLVELTWLPGQTWRDLKIALRQKWHIFHFIGHGGFDKQKDEGFVSLCDAGGQAHSFMASGLARLLANQRSLRMVLLNACEGGQGSGQDIFSSAASILVRRGMPAVLAMQYEISDRAAIELARSFYEALAAGLPVDTAVTEARQSIGFAIEGSIEWVTPVLYMHSPDGKLFDVQTGSTPPVSKTSPKPPIQKQAATKPEPPIESFTASYLAQLQKQLTSSFDEGELQDLCFQLDVEYEDLPGKGKANKARELIRYLDRRGQISALLTLCEQERPHLNWREIKLRQAEQPPAKPVQETTELRGSKPVSKPTEIDTATQPKPGATKKDKPPIILGIDLGTTNSTAVAFIDGHPSIVLSAEGGRLFPSVVSVDKDGKNLVGELAKKQATKNTIFSAGRFLGCNFDDPIVSMVQEFLPYTIKKGEKGEIQILMGDRTVTPVEVISMILRKIKTDAEDYLGRTVNQAILTVPAHFNVMQRRAIISAGELAGLEILRLISSPDAAGLAYGFGGEKDEIVALLDLGSGSFSISIMEMGDGVFEVKSTNGDMLLGGNDFDQKIINWLADEFAKNHGVDLRQDGVALRRLIEAAERAKIELSSINNMEIKLPYITATSSGPKHLEMNLTRAKLEQLTDGLVGRTVELCRLAVKDAGLSLADITRVVLVGGMTRMPAVQAAVRKFFQQEPYKRVNPEESVGIGAAIQAGVFGGNIKDVLLLPVNPLTLSIETLGGVATAFIERNTTIPNRKSQIFSTAADGQTQVEIHVTQGERPMAADNKSLGRFILDGIPPAPKGVPQIEVTFNIDVDSILYVSAKDKATGKEYQISLSNTEE